MMVTSVSCECSTDIKFLCLKSNNKNHLNRPNKKGREEGWPEELDFPSLVMQMQLQKAATLFTDIISY